MNLHTLYPSLSLILLSPGLLLYAADSSWKETRKWTYSVVTFMPTIAYKNYVGKGPCNFDTIMPASPVDAKPRVVVGPNNTILSMTDGKPTALILGDIPQSADHFRQVRATLNLATDAPLELNTWNRRFEQNFAWLGTAVKNDGHISKHYQYSTTDMMPPSQVDLIRFVNNTRNRTTHSYNHCKSGIGRSATGEIAYLLYVYSIAEKVNPDGSLYTNQLDPKTVVNAVTAYTTQQRPVVALKQGQADAAVTFYEHLQEAQSFDTLYALHAEEISARDAEFSEQPE